MKTSIKHKAPLLYLVKACADSVGLIGVDSRIIELSSNTGLVISVQFHTNTLGKGMNSTSPEYHLDCSLYSWVAASLRLPNCQDNRNLTLLQQAFLLCYGKEDGSLNCGRKYFLIRIYPETLPLVYALNIVAASGMAFLKCI